MGTAKEVADLIISTFKQGGKLLICGNGGSAAESDHFAEELVSKYNHKRKALPAIALTNSSVISSIGNDFGYRYIFSRQIEALGTPQDLLITLSTSGTSPNIIEAQQTANKLGLNVFAFPDNSDLGLPTERTQEFHLKLIHDICEIVEKEFVE